MPRHPGQRKLAQPRSQGHSDRDAPGSPSDKRDTAYEKKVQVATETVRLLLQVLPGHVSGLDPGKGKT